MSRIDSTYARPWYNTTVSNTHWKCYSYRGRLSMTRTIRDMKNSCYNCGTISCPNNSLIIAFPTSGLLSGSRLMTPRQILEAQATWVCWTLCIGAETKSAEVYFNGPSTRIRPISSARLDCSSPWLQSS